MDARRFNKKRKARGRRVALLLSDDEEKMLIEQWKKDYSFLPLSAYIRLKLFKS